MEGSRHSLKKDADKREGSRNLKALGRLGGYLRPYRLQVGLTLVALALAAGSVLAFGAGFRYLIDGAFGQGEAAALDHALKAALIVVVVLALATFARAFLVTWLGERLVADLRKDVYGHIVGLSPSFFEVTRTGEVLSRLTADTSVVQSVISASLSQALRNVLLLVGGLVLLFITNLKLTLLILVVVPLVIVPIVVIGRKVRVLSRTAQDRVGDLSGHGEETLNAVHTVQAFAQEDRERERFRTLAETAFGAAVGYAQARSLLAAVVITLISEPSSWCSGLAAMTSLREPLLAASSQHSSSMPLSSRALPAVLPRSWAICSGRPARPSVSSTFSTPSLPSRHLRTPSCCPPPRKDRSVSRTSASLIRSIRSTTFCMA